jgi:hypothetical protein
MAIVQAIDPSFDGPAVYQGLFDASVGTFPVGATEGDTWLVSVAGVIDGTQINVGSRLVANTTPTQVVEFSGEWAIIDTRDTASTQIIDSDGDTYVSVDVSDSDADTIAFTVGGTDTVTLLDSGRVTLDAYPGFAADAATSNALYLDVSGILRYGPITGAGVAPDYTRIEDADSNTFVSTEDVADTILFDAGGTNVATMTAANITLEPEVTLTAFPNSRDDGDTTTALYVDASGNLQHGSVTAVLAGIGGAAADTAFLSDGLGSGTWETVALDQTAVFNASGTTKVDTDATANNITFDANALEMGRITPSTVQWGRTSTDTVTFRGSTIRLTDIATLDSNNRALYFSGANNELKLGYIDRVVDTDGDTRVVVEATSDKDTIDLITAGTQRAQVTATGIVTNHDLEVTGSANGVILEDSGGTRWRLTINTDGSMTATSL